MSDEFKKWYSEEEIIVFDIVSAEESFYAGFEAGQQAERDRVCVWSAIDGISTYITQCDHDGCYDHVDYKYCAFCGGKIEVKN